jgi:general secretion pathway protein A
MYKDFYGFTSYPFALTADPQFLYTSENYQDCLFYLLSGLAQDQGCLVLTGEIGTGKTFLLPDFSVVLFRPDFMLASEEYPMKMHKNQ